MINTKLRYILLPLVGVAILAAPSVLGGTGTVYSAAVLIAIFAVMAYGLDVIVSDLGEVSLAHTVFFAAGCYTTGCCPPARALTVGARWPAPSWWPWAWRC